METDSLALEASALDRRGARQPHDRCGPGGGQHPGLWKTFDTTSEQSRPFAGTDGIENRPNRRVAKTREPEPHELFDGLSRLETLRRDTVVACRNLCSTDRTRVLANQRSQEDLVERTGQNLRVGQGFPGLEIQNVVEIRAVGQDRSEGIRIADEPLFVRK